MSSLEVELITIDPGLSGKHLLSDFMYRKIALLEEYRDSLIDTRDNHSGNLNAAQLLALDASILKVESEITAVTDYINSILTTPLGTE